MADKNSTTSAPDMFAMLKRLEDVKYDLGNGLDLFAHVLGLESGLPREKAFGFILTAMEAHHAKLEASFAELSEAHQAPKGGAS